jgi:hypothetical protein
MSAIANKNYLGLKGFTHHFISLVLSDNGEWHIAGARMEVGVREALLFNDSDALTNIISAVKAFPNELDLDAISNCDLEEALALIGYWDLSHYED